MLKFTLLSILLMAALLALETAKADVETVVPALAGRTSLDHSSQPSTAYDLMKNTWPKAQMVTEKSVSGWYEGRCYFRDRPNQAIAALLVVSPQESNVHGDLKGLSLRKSVVQFMNREAPATWFQKITDATKKKIERLVREEKKTSTFAYESMGRDYGLVVDFLENDVREAFQLTLRRLEGRIYTTTTCKVENRCYDQSRAGRMMFVANEGESAQYCYYFRRLRN